MTQAYNFDVHPIPCLSDNYAYLIVSRKSGHAAVIDPSECTPVLEAVSKLQVNLIAILNTHHHWDHVGGNKELLAKIPDLQVYGHTTDHDRIPGLNRPLQHGDAFTFSDISGTVLHNPGHTRGAITYVFSGCAFTGDTLFSAGCGRIFEGNADQMQHSLNHVIGALSDDTQLYFGHEYTAQNLRFAQQVEPNNAHIEAALSKVLSAPNTATTPCELRHERLINPFLRCHLPDVTAYALKSGAINTNPAEVFRVLRQAKDHF